MFVERETNAVLIDGLLETWNRRFDAEDAWPVFVLVVHAGPEGSNWRDREFNEFVVDLRAHGATARSIVVSARQSGPLRHHLVGMACASSPG